MVVDCIRPANSRIKIYIRLTQISFNDMIGVIMLSDRLPSLSDYIKLSLAELWYAYFSIKNTLALLTIPLKEKH